MNHIFVWYFVILLFYISSQVHGTVDVTTATINTTTITGSDEDIPRVITTSNQDKLTLSCNLTIPNQKFSKTMFYSIYWRRENYISSRQIEISTGISITTDDLNDADSYKTRLQLSTDLTVRPNWLENINPANTSTSFYLANLAGEYACVYNTTTLGVIKGITQITMEPIVQKMETQEVISGNDAALTCIVYGFPRPNSYQWLKKSGTSYVSIAGATNSSLIIQSTTQEHRTYYKCLAKTGFNVVANGTVYLRVKDRYAMLWPCIGIIVEMIVLLVVVGIAAYHEHVKHQQNEKLLTKDM